ncbi:hypothetical protein [Haloarchaeobius litoreus]|uniref:Cyclin-like domain-containing protein n=1 Tax=Haloarchaeobius litoreus TaxID=755306 RepID=A0ABD6DLG0_9EURY
MVHSGVELKFSEPGWTAWTDRRGGPIGSASRLAIGTVVGEAGGSSRPRWAQYNRRLSHNESTLRHGLKEVRALAAALEATESMTEAAGVAFRRSADVGLLVGQSLESVAAASIYLVAREHGQPFPLAHVVSVSPVDRQAVKSAYSKLVREFDAAVAPPLPTAFIHRFASAVGVSQSVCRLATDIASTIVGDGVHVGQSPTGVAAAVIYGAARSCGEAVTQEDLADVAFVSVVTLSRQWQRVKTYFESSGQ